MKLDYFCARGCGAWLEPWYRFCPMCGQSFGSGNFGTVAQSRRRRDGLVDAKPRAPRPPGSESSAPSKEE